MSRKPPEMEEPYSLEEEQAINREAWERATWLSDVVAQRLTNLPEDETLRRRLGPGNYTIWRRQLIEHTLLREFVAGMHEVYCCWNQDSEPMYDQIDPAHWPGKTLHSSRNASSGDSQNVNDIRVVQNIGVGAGSVPETEAGGEPDLPGATSYEVDRKNAILDLYRTRPGFLRLKLQTRLELVKEKMGDAAPRGFGRSSFYETLRDLQDTGQIPSKNVRSRPK